MKLGDCKSGDKVILWCDGWGRYDTEVTLIKDTTGILISVETPVGSGNTNRFVKDTKCMKA